MSNTQRSPSTAERRAAIASCLCSRCRNRASTRRGFCDSCYGTVMKRQKAYGRWESGRVDAQPAREHVVQLLASGLGTRHIADLAGVSRLAVQRLVSGRRDIGDGGPTRQLMRTTAEKLLAVSVPRISWETAAPMALVDGIGTRRRLQALVADGHPFTELDDAVGWSRGSLGRILNRPGVVTAGTARTVAELFDRLQMHPGADERARRRGARRGWALPMQWDEDAIDDPAGEPHQVRRPVPAAASHRALHRHAARERYAEAS